MTLMTISELERVSGAKRSAIHFYLREAIGAQIGVTAVKYIRGYGIRLLFAIMIILAGIAVVFKQLGFKPYDAIVVMGGALGICAIIIFKLWAGFKKEKADKMMGIGH